MILWWCFLLKLAEKHFGFEERVKLVNPRITAEGYKIGTRGFTNYLLHADEHDKRIKKERKNDEISKWHCIR